MSLVACALAAALECILGRRRGYHQTGIGSGLSRKCKSGDSEVMFDYRDEDVSSPLKIGRAGRNWVIGNPRFAKRSHDLTCS